MRILTSSRSLGALNVFARSSTACALCMTGGLLLWSAPTSGAAGAGEQDDISARCADLLDQRHALLAVPGGVTRKVQRLSEIDAAIRGGCLGEDLAPAVGGRVLLFVSETTDLDRALAHEQQARLEEARALLGQAAPKSREMILVLERIAGLTGVYSVAESDQLLEEALRLRAEVYGPDSREAALGQRLRVAYVRFRGATESEQQADLPAARELAESFVRDSVARFGEGDPVTVVAWSDLAEIVRGLEGSDAAELLLEEHVHPYRGALTRGFRLAHLVD